MSALSKLPSRPLVAALAVAAAFVLGWVLRGPGPSPSASAEGAHDHAAEAAPTVWTCSMHPQIRLPEPGLCPLCHMELVPAGEAGGAEDGDRELVFSETARRLARIRTAPVERRFPTVEVRLVGKVDYDETRVRDITAWVPGRLDRLFVDYTGLPVARGEHMVEIYSPALIAAQEELVRALDARDSLRESSLEIMRRTAEETVEAARGKLRLLGLLPEQVARLEETRETSDHVTLYAPLSGVVIEKHVQQGGYVETGTPIYTLADLDHLWVRLEAYESDMEWIHHGQEVEFAAEAYPGTTFRGRVSFIDPVVDPRTRTVKIRVNLRNEGRRLKPDMFVRAVVRTQVAGGGRIFDPYLAGKWISPMHPWVVKEGPGSCDVCGMDLVPAETLGFVPDASGLEAPLVIPATAPLLTGKRAVVYVEVPGAERPTYEGREVELGARAGELYVVRSGLAEGERVVVEGNFKIDSALQIRARPSMMSPEGGPPPGHDHGTAPPAAGHDGHGSRGGPASAALGEALGPFYRTVLDLGAALAADDAEAARESFRRVERALHHLDPAALRPGDRALWERHAAGLHGAVVAGGNAAEIRESRAAFRTLSESAVALAREVGHVLEAPFQVAFCPMVEGGGAEWLQREGPLANPYFGASMLRCGTVRATLAPRADGGAEERP